MERVAAKITFGEREPLFVPTLVREIVRLSPLAAKAAAVAPTVGKVLLLLAEQADTATIRQTTTIRFKVQSP